MVLRAAVFDSLGIALGANKEIVGTSIGYVVIQCPQCNPALSFASSSKLMTTTLEKYGGGINTLWKFTYDKLRH